MKSFFLVLLSIATVSVHAQNSIDDARAAYERREYPTVIRITSAILGKTPKDENALLLRGLSRMEMKDPKACEDGTKLLKLDSGLLEAYLFLSECKQRQGDLKGAVAILDRAERRWPDSSQIPYAKAIAYTRGQRWADAIEYLETVVARRPENTKAAFLLAQCYARTGNDKDAADLFGRIIDAEPGEIFARWALADLMMKQNRTDSAITLYREILKLNPDVTGVYKAYATALHLTGQAAEAVKVLSELVKRTPTDAEAWYNLGVAQQSMQDHSGATRSYKKAIELRQNYAEAYFNLALSQVEDGFMEEGVKSFQRCAMLSPTLAPGAYNSIAVIHRMNSQFDESIAASKEAISLADSVAEYHATLGYTYIAAKKNEEGIKIMEPVRSRFPTDPDVLFVIGKMYARVGRTEEARQIATQLDALNPTFAKELKELLQ